MDPAYTCSSLVTGTTHNMTGAPAGAPGPADAKIPAKRIYTISTVYPTHALHNQLTGQAPSRPCILDPRALLPIISQADAFLDPHLQELAQFISPTWIRVAG